MSIKDLSLWKKKDVSLSSYLTLAMFKLELQTGSTGLGKILISPC